jgi:hypothetical protein
MSEITITHTPAGQTAPITIVFDMIREVWRTSYTRPGEDQEETFQDPSLEKVRAKLERVFNPPEAKKNLRIPVLFVHDKLRVTLGEATSKASGWRGEYRVSITHQGGRRESLRLRKDSLFANTEDNRKRLTEIDGLTQQVRELEKEQFKLRRLLDAADLTAIEEE